MVLINRIIVSAFLPKYWFVSSFANFMWRLICCQTTALNQTQAQSWPFAPFIYHQGPTFPHNWLYLTAQNAFPVLF